MLEMYMCVWKHSFLSEPEDYIDKSGIFTFTNTTSTQCTFIVIVNDTVSESGKECFTVELSNTTVTSNIPNVATVCITGN